MSKLYYEAIRAMPEEWITDELWVTELESVEKVIAIPHEMSAQVYKGGKWQPLDIIHFGGKNYWPVFHETKCVLIKDPPLFARSTKAQDPEDFTPILPEACDHPVGAVVCRCEKCGEEV